MHTGVMVPNLDSDSDSEGFAPANPHLHQQAQSAKARGLHDVQQRVGRRRQRTDEGAEQQERV